MCMENSYALLKCLQQSITKGKEMSYILKMIFLCSLYGDKNSPLSAATAHCLM